jgi:hypothetical protein
MAERSTVTAMPLLLPPLPPRRRVVARSAPPAQAETLRRLLPRLRRDVEEDRQGGSRRLYVPSPCPHWTHFTNFYIAVEEDATKDEAALVVKSEVED